MRLLRLVDRPHACALASPQRDRGDCEQRNRGRGRSTLMGGSWIRRRLDSASRRTTRPRRSLR